MTSSINFIIIYLEVHFFTLLLLSRMSNYCYVYILLKCLCETLVPAGGLRGAWFFDKFRRHHNRTCRFYLGPKNVHFWKTHFSDTKLKLGFLKLIRKIGIIPGTFLSFAFFTTVPKNGQKDSLQFIFLLKNYQNVP